MFYLLEVPIGAILAWHVVGPLKAYLERHALEVGYGKECTNFRAVDKPQSLLRQLDILQVHE